MVNFSPRPSSVVAANETVQNEANRHKIGFSLCHGSEGPTRNTIGWARGVFEC